MSIAANEPPAGPGADQPYITPGARRATRRLQWGIIGMFLFFCSMTVVLLAAWVQQRTLLEHQIQADCNVWVHLAPLPVTLNAETHKPTLLSVQLISDSRVAWVGKGCASSTGVHTLPAPNPLFVQWAQYYRLPVN